MINDARERHQALDVSHSYIVQAPAGSGKTELLTQRFLKLLTVVDKHPEEVLAITFTNKAASEMRQRIVSALHLGTQAVAPVSEHKHATWQLAQKVLHRNTQENWDLLDNPNRLRIQTIDALCLYLSKNLPITSHLGGNVQASSETDKDYEEAATLTINTLEQKTVWQKHLCHLLLHLDNNITTIKSMFVNMLKHRDQWLRHIVSATTSTDNIKTKEHLEMSLRRINEDALTRIEEHFPARLKEELNCLLHFAIEHSIEVPKSPLHNIKCFEALSPIKQWQLTQQFLMTKTGDWRKQVTKNIGFPVGKTKDEKTLFTDYKKRYKDLIEQLIEATELEDILQEIAILPPVSYSENQWKVLDSLLTLLPILAAQLKLVFHRKGHVDFIEITQSALDALHDEQTPTDLALCLDYKIKHMLIDEFQDTSASQFQLLRLLTAGWEPHDGRTLFVVGDPMQSIYRFRAAEVGLFLKTQQEGIGHIHLKSLRLQANFRSSQTLVNWFNHLFPDVFSAEDNIALGAIQYNVSEAVKEEPGFVRFHSAEKGNKQDEAQTIVNVIKETKKEIPDSKIAILVKTRRQLTEIMPALRRAEIAFQAVEIETLSHLPYIQDLAALTQALLHQHDSLSWLSVLRSPFCGLTLHDLYGLTNDKRTASIWKAMQLPSTLSSDGKKRLLKIVPIIKNTLQQRCRLSLGEWVKATWFGLQGPSCLENNAQLEDCFMFFTLLDTLEQGATLENMTELPRQLEKLYSQNTADPNVVQIMTIHKAKGLEFDVVIIPSLETAPRPSESQLLLWQERPNSTDDIDLLLAPIKAKADEYDPIYKYVQLYENKKDQLELARLFYVAVTRAKNRLHLLSSFDDEMDRPREASFLSFIWDKHRSDFIQTCQEKQPTFSNDKETGLKQLTLTTIAQQKPLIPTLPSTEFRQHNLPQWHNYCSASMGTLIHYLLQQLSAVHFSVWPSIYQNTAYLKALIKQFGLSYCVNDSLVALQKCFENISASETAKWILDSTHEAAASECEFMIKENATLKNIVLDRTFIDKGQRWVIDYKTSVPNSKQHLDEFIQQEKEVYLQQLLEYSNVFVDEKRACRLALYFPFIDQFTILN